MYFGSFVTNRWVRGWLYLGRKEGETMRKDNPKIVYCWSCGTDLRQKNIKLHEHLGHRVEELDQHPKRVGKEDPKEAKRPEFGEGGRKP